MLNPKNTSNDKNNYTHDINFPLFPIICIGIATLLYEIILTRIFSVTMWYHFAFMAISLALFGIAASGVLITVAPNYFNRDNALSVAGFSAVRFALSIPLCFLIDLNIPFIPFDAAGNNGLGVITPYILFSIKFLVLSIPFFFSGLVIAIAFTYSPRQVNRTYFADLLGGGVGCALVIPILIKISAPGAIFLTSTVAFLAAIIFFKRLGKINMVIFSVMGLLFTMIFVIFNEQFNIINITKIKSYHPDIAQVVERPKIYERWHPVSRVAVHPINISRSPMDWFNSYPIDNYPRVFEVTNDGGARTFIFPERNKKQYKEIFKYDVSDVAFLLKSNPRVLVIGVGGGKDVLSSLSLGAMSVTAVELNPIMIDIVQNVFSEFTGKPYDNPKVQVVIDEGRNYVASNSNSYDVIKMSVTDTWAASSVGAYALVENYLYTQEAIEDFINHLEKGGYLSITRWYPQESLRLVSLAASFLRNNGFKNPESRIAMVRNHETMTLLIKNGQITSDEASLFEAIAQKAGHIVVHIPKSPFVFSKSKYDELHREILLESSRKDFSEGKYFVNISPPTDDKPFFFNLVTFDDVQRGHYGSKGGFIRQHSRGLVILLGLLKISVAVAVIFVLGPLIFSGKKLDREVPRITRFSINLYFLALGLGYLLVEIPLIQRFILFLGHPVYALTITLFSLLVSSAFGSLMARRIPMQNKMLLGIISVSIVTMILIVGKFLPGFLKTEMNLPISLRILLSILVISPIGFMMGIPFPTGLRVTHNFSQSLVPWAWAINGAASVAAPVIAMIVAIVWGFSVAFYMGAAAYACAALILIIILNHQSNKSL